MAQRIQIPGVGIVEFPDGMSQQDMSAAIQKNFPNVSRQAANSPADDAGTLQFGPIDTGIPLPVSVTRGLAGAGKTFADIYRGGKQLLNIGDQAQLQNEIDEAKRRDAPLMDTTAGKVGNFIGNVAVAAPTAFIPGANSLVGGTLIGGVMGAASPVASGESRFNNTVMGGVGGLGGSAAGKVVGRIANPVQSRLSPELQDLANKAEQMGIPLDAADKTGSRPLKVVRSVMESLPLTADKQAALNDAKRAAFNRAVLDNIGEVADKATPDVLNAARQRIGSQYATLSANKSIPLGQDFINSLDSIDSSITPFSSPGIRSAVDKGYDLATQSPISGVDYQKIRSVLGSASSDAFRGNSSELGQALKTIRNSLDDAAQQTLSPADQAAWKEANRQYQNLKVVEKAAAPTSADAVSGNVSPAKLAQALMSTDKQGMIYGTRGDNMGDLARIGQAFVKDQIPNSGTAERSFYTKFLTNPVEAIWQGGVGGISLPVQKLMNSDAGQAYLQNGLIPMNAKTKMMADILRQGATGGGASVGIDYAAGN
jgi:hypothetical protein